MGGGTLVDGVVRWIQRCAPDLLFFLDDTNDPVNNDAPPSPSSAGDPVNSTDFRAPPSARVAPQQTPRGSQGDAEEKQFVQDFDCRSLNLITVPLRPISRFTFVMDPLKKVSLSASSSPSPSLKSFPELNFVQIGKRLDFHHPLLAFLTGFEDFFSFKIVFS